MQLDSFRQEGRTKSNQFLYWDTLIKSIYPVLRDLTGFVQDFQNKIPEFSKNCPKNTIEKMYTFP